MNSRKNNLITGSLIVALSLAIGLSSRNQANADPTGTRYEVTTRNAPNSGRGETTFDGAGFETIPLTGIDIDEHATAFDGGELLEFWVRTTSGESFVAAQDNRDEPSTIWIEGLHWRSRDGSEMPGVIVPDSAFIYYTANGEPLPMGNPFGLDFEFGRSPTNPNIQTVLLGNGPLPANAAHLGTDILGEGATFLDVFAALDLNPRIVNDFHFGFVVRHVPEPGSFVMALIGGGLLIVAGRRRRIR